ncbi:MAG: nucleotide exchange factor GrpE [Actinomycetes bacterium]
MSESAAESLTEESAAEEVEVLEEAASDPLAVLTDDLQRLQAEYSNYRKRVERDRELARDMAVAAVLHEMLPTLDDLERAREHGELEGGFKAVADQLEKLTAKLGLEKYGSVGEAFDPTVHEALIHATSNEVTEAIASAILQPGYRFKDRILRPARVAVTEPE